MLHVHSINLQIHICFVTMLILEHHDFYLYSQLNNNMLSIFYQNILFHLFQVASSLAGATQICLIKMHRDIANQKHHLYTGLS